MPVSELCVCAKRMDKPLSFVLVLRCCSALVDLLANLAMTQAKHQDVDALDRCLNAGLAHGDLEAEDPSTLTLTNVLRVARLCQLAIQYFIATQEGLVSEVASLQVDNSAFCNRQAKIAGPCYGSPELSA